MYPGKCLLTSFAGLQGYPQFGRQSVICKKGRGTRAAADFQAIARLAKPGLVTGSQHNVGAWVGHARQNTAFGLLFAVEARPFDLIAHRAAQQSAYAGTAISHPAGTGPIAATLLQ